MTQEIRCRQCGDHATLENTIICPECGRRICDNCYDTGKGDGCKCHTRINVGDSVRTVNQMYFVEANHPTKGTIEVTLPRWHRLTVCGINRRNRTVTVTVQLPDGYTAVLHETDVEP